MLKVTLATIFCSDTSSMKAWEDMTLNLETVENCQTCQAHKCRDSPDSIFPPIGLVVGAGNFVPGQIDTRSRLRDPLIFPDTQLDIYNVPFLADGGARSRRLLRWSLTWFWMVRGCGTHILIDQSSVQSDIISLPSLARSRPKRGSLFALLGA